MRIGFFGDSYVDILLKDSTTQETSWGLQLLQDLDSPFISTGYSGTGQYHSVANWHKTMNYLAENNRGLDVAIWTFTWADRIFSPWNEAQAIFSAAAENRLGDIELFKQKNKNLPDGKIIEEIIECGKLYMKYQFDEQQNNFFYECTVNWILNLPARYPGIKFIFIPNTEFSRNLALKYHRRGILLNFAFETLSNKEPESPGPMPIDCTRVGHINKSNRIHIKNIVKNLIHTYTDWCSGSRGHVEEIDYDLFDIKK